MIKIFLMVLIAVGSGKKVDCLMDQITSFEDCTIICIKKYGFSESSQRQFYNRKTKKCEPKKKCIGKFHRYYENRCLQEFEITKINGMLVSIPEDYVEIQIISEHATNYSMLTSFKCYPGFISSQKRKKITDHVFQQHICDIKNGSNPSNYPNTHGQYFYHQLSASQQKQIAQEVLVTQPLLDIKTIICFIIEGLVIFMIVWDCVSRIFKKTLKPIVQRNAQLQI